MRHPPPTGSWPGGRGPSFGPGDAHGGSGQMEPRAETYTPPIVSDVPLPLVPGLPVWFEGAFDREGKLVRALEELGPLTDRDVLLIGDVPAWLADRLVSTGARVERAVSAATPADGATPADADVVIGAWSSFRGVDPGEVADAQRWLRPGGRLLIVHDYGRDDIATLTGDRPESSTWSRRGGPFTAAGFKIRVVHCFWTFDSMDDAASFLGAAFGEAGAECAASLRRARLSHNVAIYHRTAGPA